MSYILDALRKLEEKEGAPARPGSRLGGGDGPAGRPPRRRWGYLLAAGVIIAVAAFIGLPGRGGRELPSDAEQAPGTDVPDEREAAETAAAAETALGDPIPAESRSSEAAAEDRAAGAGAAAVPAAPAAAGAETKAVAAEEVGTAPLPKDGEEVSFEEVFGDLDLEDASAAAPDVIAEDAWDAALPGGRPRKSGGVTGGVVSPAPPESGRLYRYEELPDALKAELGELDITGHIYSEDAAFRLIMVNDGVRREGDTVSPGVVLKAITSAGAHFSYRGYLFLIEAF